MGMEGKRINSTTGEKRRAAVAESDKGKDSLGGLLGPSNLWGVAIGLRGSWRWWPLGGEILVRLADRV